MFNDDAAVGVTRPECPEWREPIRRVTRADGTHIRFRVVVDATPPGANRRQQVTRTLSTLQEARDFVVQVRSEVAAAGAYTAPATETVKAVSERWLSSRRDVRLITLQGYRSDLQAPWRFLGDRDIQTITVVDVEHLVNWMAEQGGRKGRPLGARAVRGALVALGQVFDSAAREGLVSSNPVRLARRPRHRKRVGRDLEHWQPEELIRFRDHADTDDLAGAWRLTLAGLTRADVMGLRWTDVNLETGVVSISQGRIAMTHGPVVDDPKSAQRRRAVPVEQIHPGTVALLKPIIARQAADKLKVGPAWEASGYVVTDALGHPVRPEAYSDRFRVLCTAAGVPSITLHSVRHSLAFWLHQLGVAPADAAALLGHTVEVHLSTYLPHSGAAGISAAAAALGKAGAAKGRRGVDVA